MMWFIASMLYGALMGWYARRILAWIGIKDHPPAVLLFLLVAVAVFGVARFFIERAL